MLGRVLTPYGRALPSRPSQKGFELLADDFMEKGLFGFAAFVLDGGDQSTGTMKWGAALHAKAIGAPRQSRCEARSRTGARTGIGDPEFASRGSAAGFGGTGDADRSTPECKARVGPAPGIARLLVAFR